MEETIKKWAQRPFSWSQLSSWEYDHEQWYKKYILNEKPEDNKEMAFGRKLAEALEYGTCEIKELVDKLPYKKEHPFKVNFNGITLCGWADDFDDKTFKVLNEVKTGKKAWTADRVKKHGQIDMYLLMNYITNKIKPEDVKCTLHWLPTSENGDFSLDFVRPIVVHSFPTKRTMRDILAFGARVNAARAEMITYIQSKSDTLTS
jgi:hypothetical protein